MPVTDFNVSNIIAKRNFDKGLYIILEKLTTIIYNSSNFNPKIRWTIDKFIKTMKSLKEYMEKGKFD